MIRSKLFYSFLLGLTLATGACTPSPEKVCAHLKEISKDDPKAQDAEKCKTMMTILKAGMGDKWKDAAKCMMAATDKTGVRACIKASGL